MKLYQVLMIGALSANVFASTKTTYCTDHTFFYNELNFTCFTDHCEAIISGQGPVDSRGNKFILNTLNGANEVLGRNGEVFLNFKRGECQVSDDGMSASCTATSKNNRPFGKALISSRTFYDDVRQKYTSLYQDVHADKITLSFNKGSQKSDRDKFTLTVEQYEKSQQWDISLRSGDCQVSDTDKSLFPEEVISYLKPR